MQDLKISWPSGSKVFSKTDSPVTLGRSLESSVVVSELTASRQHILFEWTNGVWYATDVSTHGTFTDDGSRLGQTWVVGQAQGVRLGDPDGADITLETLASDPDETPKEPESTEPTSEQYQMTNVMSSSAEAKAVADAQPLMGSLPSSPSFEPTTPPPSPSSDTNFQPDQGGDSPAPWSGNWAPSSTRVASEPSKEPTKPPPGPTDSQEPSTDESLSQNGGYDPMSQADQEYLETNIIDLASTSDDQESVEVVETPMSPTQNAIGEDSEQTNLVSESGFGLAGSEKTEISSLSLPTNMQAENEQPSETSMSEPDKTEISSLNLPTNTTQTENEQPSETSMSEPDKTEISSLNLPTNTTQTENEQPSDENEASNPGASSAEPSLFNSGLLSAVPNHESPFEPASTDTQSQTDTPGLPDAQFQTGTPGLPDAQSQTGTPGLPDAQFQTGTPGLPPSPAQQETNAYPPSPAQQTNALPAQIQDSAQGNGAPGNHWANQASATAVATDVLRIAVDDQNYVFNPGQEVTIGRDQTCSVVLDQRHSLTSRQHVKFVHRDGHWWLEDFSSKGTFVDGRQIKKAYKAQGGFKVLLGNKQAGTEIKVVAPGEHATTSRERLLILGAIGAVALLLIVGVGAAAATGRFSSSETTVSTEEAAAANLENAKLSTALLLVASEEGTGLGSGFFVADNLVVTNQHVVTGDADGVIEIAVTTEIDAPVESKYTGEVLQLHPYLDIAVVKLNGSLVPAPEGQGDPRIISGDFTVGPLETGNTNSVQVGNSSENITLGDTVFTTGFPSSFTSGRRNAEGKIQSLPPVGTDQGNAASYLAWPGCDTYDPSTDTAIPQGSPATVTCNNGGDISNAIMVATFTSGPGASGSAVYKGDKVIGVVYAGPGRGESNASRAIATSGFVDWLNEILAAN